MILIYTFSGEIFEHIISCFIAASQHHLQSQSPKLEQLELQYEYLYLLFQLLKRNEAKWDHQTIKCFNSYFISSLMTTLKYLTYHDDIYELSNQIEKFIECGTSIVKLIQQHKQKVICKQQNMLVWSIMLNYPNNDNIQNAILYLVSYGCNNPNSLNWFHDELFYQHLIQQIKSISSVISSIQIENIQNILSILNRLLKLKPSDDHILITITDNICDIICFVTHILTKMSANDPSYGKLLLNISKLRIVVSPYTVSGGYGSKFLNALLKQNLLKRYIKMSLNERSVRLGIIAYVTDIIQFRIDTIPSDIHTQNIQLILYCGYMNEIGTMGSSLTQYEKSRILWQCVQLFRIGFGNLFLNNEIIAIICDSLKITDNNINVVRFAVMNIQEMLKRKLFSSKIMLYNEGEVIDILISNATETNTVNAGPIAACFVLLSNLIKKEKMTCDEIKTIEKIFQNRDHEMTRVVQNLFVDHLNGKHIKYIKFLIDYFQP